MRSLSNSVPQFFFALVCSALVLVACGGDNGSGFPVGSASSKLYVTNSIATGDAAVLIYNNANTIASNSSPNRVVTGVATTLNNPLGIAVDTARALLYVANNQNDAILVFNNVKSLNGNTAPSRLITGTNTQLNKPAFLYLDTANDRLYVTNLTGHSIVVFDEVSTKTGNIVPNRVISGAATTLNGPTGIFVDVARNKMYVANSADHRLVIFANASTAAGNQAPAQSLAGAATSLSAPQGLFVDVLNDRLYVANRDNNRVLVFASISTAFGDIAPSRSLFHASINKPHDVFVDLANDRLYLANFAGNSVLVFNAASTVTGAVAPTRTLALPTATPFAGGVFVDSTPVFYASTADLDGDIRSNGTSNTAGGSPLTGDLGAPSLSLASRQLFSFDLSRLPTTAKLKSARLHLYQAKVQGNPYFNLGELVVDHMSYNNTAITNGSAYTGSSLSLDMGTLSTNTALEYKTLDVTSQVRNDIETARNKAQFRLHFSLVDTNSDLLDDYVQFTDSEDSCCVPAVNRPPLLEITLEL